MQGFLGKTELFYQILVLFLILLNSKRLEQKKNLSNALPF